MTLEEQLKDSIENIIIKLNNLVKPKEINDIISENYSVLNNYCREKAIEQLHKSTERFGKTIDKLRYFTCVSVDDDFKASSLSDNDIKVQLKYITDNIAIYLLYENMKCENFDKLAGDK